MLLDEELVMPVEACVLERLGIEAWTAPRRRQLFHQSRLHRFHAAPLSIQRASSGSTVTEREPYAVTQALHSAPGVAHDSRRLVVADGCGLPRHAQCKVETATSGELNMSLPKIIVAATDFSAAAARAQADAVALAKALKARLVLVHVWQPPLFAPEGFYTEEVMSQLEADHQAKLNEALVHARAELPGAEQLLFLGDTRAGIVAAAHELQADLIVLGTRGHRGFQRALLGSVAEWVVHHALCATWLVREPDAARKPV